MKFIDNVFEWLYSICIAMALAFVINIFLVQHMIVEGHSMDPTLYDKEHLVVSKLQHSFNSMPEYGDIVVIDSRVTRARSFKDDLAEPVAKFISQQEYVFIKRVIGKPGDVLEFRDGFVLRNGVKLEEPYLLEAQMKFPQEKTVVVAENSVFVMGDNRNHSLDSRSLGNIPLDHVIGKMIIKM